MNRRGMTLLELIVGLTVTAMVISAGMGAVAMLADRRQAAAELMRAESRAAAARQALVGWLAGARLTADDGGPSFRGLDGVRDDLPDDELSFLTTARTPLGQGEAVVRIYLDRDDATPEEGLTAEFAEWRGLETRRVELDPRVRGLDIRYVSRVLGGRIVLPSWISSTVLPAGVEVALLPGAGDTLPPLLARPMLVTFREGR